MKEDACQIYREEGSANLAAVRHIALNMLRSERSKKVSIRRKQKIAAMNSSYLEQVLLSGFNEVDEK
ncbi:hypothetical protein WP8S18E11_10450 [Aeromonas veronii]|nr:hypothetical protein WP8S18E11_10450 [Aeromonas veronii]